LVSDGLHEVFETRDFVVWDILCLDVAVYIDAVVETVSVDEPVRTHLDLPFPGDLSINVLVGKRSPPCFSLGEFESFRR
jgi:hypothetical protein